MTLENKLNLMRESLNRQSNQEFQNLMDSDRCPLCGGIGYIISNRGEGQLSADPCKCLLIEREQSRLRFANLPEAFKDMTLKTFNIAAYKEPESREKINAACQIIKRYIEYFDDMHDAGMGLYLYSCKKGSGKTRMAASIVNELLGRGKVVKFATSMSILKEIKDTWDKGNSYSESRLLDQLVLADILVIDDFGSEKVAEWINEKFYHIVNERYISHKVTIFTSNDPLEQLQYDDRITSRIKENTYQVAFPEESIRDQIAKKNMREMLKTIRAGD